MADGNGAAENQGQALSDAAFRGDITQIDALLARGVHVDTKDNDGFTALHRSCVTGKVNIIRHLLTRGADPKAEDSYGDTPLHYACFCGHVKAVAELCNSGADPHQVSKDGKTPTDSAREENHVEVLTWISQHCKPPPPRPAQGAKPPSAPAAPPCMIAGLDFGKGVVVEGELHKKRANKMMKWRRKYYVLSKEYGAMFFWTGSREAVEGVVKKVRFETFHSVKLVPGKQHRRRFDIKVITGRVMQLMAPSAEAATMWVDALNEHIGELMGAVRIQCVWRGHKSRRQAKSLLAQRQRAVDMVRGAAGGGGDASKQEDRVLIEGVLRKRVSSALIGGTRVRYWVLNAGKGLLTQYENKAKRNLQLKPRNTPILSFLSVEAETNKRDQPTRRFTLRLNNGLDLILEAATTEEAQRWVGALASVMPRDHIAATRIQAVHRGRQARKQRALLAANRRATIERIKTQYGQPGHDAATKIASIVRMRAVVRKHGSAIRKAMLDARRAEAVKRSRLYLKQARKGEDGGAAGGGGTRARLARLRELKKKQEQTGGDGDWEEHVDKKSGRTFWFNPKTGDRSWTNPTRRIGDWVEVRDEEGKVYWNNSKTGKSRWTTPEEPVGEQPEWVEELDEETGETYYARTSTGEVVNEKPEGFDEMMEAWRAAHGEFKWTVRDHYEEHADEESGKSFYVSKKTGTSQWEKPVGWDGGEDDDVRFLGWAEVEDETGRKYYYHTESQRRTWKHPRELLRKKAAKGKKVAKKASAWSKQVDEDTGDVFFYNAATEESRWQDPEEAAALAAAEPEAFDESEVLAFSNWVTFHLQGRAAGSAEEDPAVTPLAALLPVAADEEPPAIFQAVRSGVIPALLVNSVAPGTIDERVVAMEAEAGRLRAVGEGEEQREIRPALDNCRLAISAAQSVGAKFEKDDEVTAERMEQGRPRAVMGFVWALWRVQLLEPLSVRATNEAVALADEDRGEGVKEMLRVNPEALLLRWLNFLQSGHVSIAGPSGLPAGASGRAGPPPALPAGCLAKPVDKLGEELQDGRALAALLHELAPEHREHLPDDFEEYEQMGVESVVGNSLWVAFQIGLPEWFSVEAFTSGNQRLQLAVLATLFSVMPALGGGSEEEEEEEGEGEEAGATAEAAAEPAATAEAAPASPAPAAAGGITASPVAKPASSPARGLTRRSPMKRRQTMSGAAATLAKELASMMHKEETDGVTRETRVLTAWVNSLGLKNTHVHDIIHDMTDGIVLLRILNSVEPGIVTWRRVVKKPKNKYQRLENCNLAVQLCEALELKIVNLQGLDIVDGVPKLITSLIWQLMRHHTLKVLSSVAFSGFEVDDKRVLQWANERVTESNDGDTSLNVHSLGDPSLSNSVFLLRVLSQIKPIVDWGLVSDGDSPADKQANAKYLMSLARSLGAAVFGTWEDVVAVKKQTILLFLSSLIVVEQKVQAARAEAEAAAAAAAAEEEDDGDEEEEDVAYFFEEVGADGAVDDSDDEGDDVDVPEGIDSDDDDEDEDGDEAAAAAGADDDSD